MFGNCYRAGIFGTGTRTDTYQFDFHEGFSRGRSGSFNDCLIYNGNQFYYRCDTCNYRSQSKDLIHLKMKFRGIANGYFQS